MKLSIQEESKNTVAIKRVGTQLPPDCEVVRLLGDKDGSMSRFINQVVLGPTTSSDLPYSSSSEKIKKMVISKDVPVELRIYEKTGAGMEWHVDDILYEPKQVEVIFTLENNSDCVTQWKTESDHQDLKQVETEANSVILLQAGGVEHSVSALHHGRRVILKFVFVEEGAEFVSGSEDILKQFSVSKGMKSGGKRKKRR